MRIPDQLLASAQFLCVDDAGGLRMGGTAFFLILGDEPPHIYLVTARHCIKEAAFYGRLGVRINKQGGGAEVIWLDGAWYYPDSPADDVAVLPWQLTGIPDLSVAPVDTRLTATDAVIASEGIGIGDEIVAVGLFTRRDGKHENRPIVRSGIISAMPDEPLQDIKSGLDYDAYLVETRSIAGLSGSPVYLVLPPGRVREDTLELERRNFYLLGVVRGHWDKRAAEFADWGESEVEQFNTGIAIVTPIQKAIEVILNTDELVRKRREFERWWAKVNAGDAAVPRKDV